MKTAPFVDPYQDPRTLWLLHGGITALAPACLTDKQQDITHGRISLSVC